MKASFINRWSYQTLDQMEFVLFSYTRIKSRWFNGFTIIFINFAIIFRFKYKPLIVVEYNDEEKKDESDIRI
jgi:hypothetical protein